MQTEEPGAVSSAPRTKRRGEPEEETEEEPRREG